MMSLENLETGIMFYDSKQGLLKLQNWGSHGPPWLWYKHPDGEGWVSLRKATDEDIRMVGLHTGMGP